MDHSQQRKLFKELRRAGWTVAMGGKGHWKVSDPSGRLVTTIAASGSDRRGDKNLFATLRRAGFITER